MKTLFSPFQLRSLKLENRIVMAPVGTNLASENGYVSDRLIEYYRRRAQGGIGLIIVEAAVVEPRGIAIPRELSMYENKTIEGLGQLASVIKKEGSYVALQLQHSGKQTNSALIGTTPISPSPGSCPRSKEISREMSLEDIEQVIEFFASAALKVKQAGFDAVEIHGASGYLLGQFLSPHTNHRRDQFGGNLEGRARFPLEVVRRVRKRVGPDFIVGYRLAAEEFVEDGLHLDEALKFIKMLEPVGIDYIHATAGIVYETGEWIASPIYISPGPLVYVAHAIKKVSRIPVIAVGRINDPNQAEKILVEGKADLVALGRALVADPDFVIKAKEGKEDGIIRCIACNYCANRILVEHTEIACSMNPETGREKEFEIVISQNPKKVVIVGGGPGGLEAARVLKLRGHNVHLFEEKGYLGGKLVLASKPPHKEEILDIIHFYERQMEKLKIHVSLSQHMTEKEVLAQKPDAVVIATGSMPNYPNSSDVPGIEVAGALQATEVLAAPEVVGSRVVIIGGGLVGGETAAFLSALKREVIILEMLKYILSDVEVLTRKMLIQNLKKSGVQWKTLVRISQVGKGFVRFVDAEGNEGKIEADTIILATGATPDNKLEKMLKGKVKELYCIGDSLNPRRATEAIYEGALIGRKI